MIIRVFARRTSYTPTDDLAFYGDPPIPVLRDYARDYPIAVSATFTWDKEKAIQLTRTWSLHFKNVECGGPAFDHPGGQFFAGDFIKKGITFTSRGRWREFCHYWVTPKLYRPTQIIHPV